MSRVRMLLIWGIVVLAFGLLLNMRPWNSGSRVSFGELGAGTSVRGLTVKSPAPYDQSADHVLRDAKARWPQVFAGKALPLTLVGDGSATSVSLRNDLRVTLPASFNETVQVEGSSGRGGGGVRVAARPIGARNVLGYPADGGKAWVYQDAYAGLDVIYRGLETRTEEYLVVCDPPRDGLLRLEWDLVAEVTQGTGSASLRLTPAHSVEVLDDLGVPRLRVQPPQAWDAQGRRLVLGEDIRLELDGTRLTCVAGLRDASFPVLIDPTWASTGSMTVGRDGHDQTLLADGRVLVTGGTSLGVNTPTCEIFDPFTSTWSVTDSMSRARNAHRTVLLKSGKALAIGGKGSSGANIPNCEIYDPGTGHWSPTGSLVLPPGSYETGRSGHDAVCLGDGRVLCTFGFPTGNVQFFDPQAGTWTDSGAGPNSSGVATLLSDGRVVITGFTGSIGPHIYTPETNTWNRTLPLVGLDRIEHSATLLKDGRILVAGGYSSSLGLTNTCEIYNPGTNAWSAVASMTEQRRLHAAGFLPDGRVFVAGGTKSLSLADSLDSCEAYDPVLDKWAPLTPLNVPRYVNRTGSRAVSLQDGTALISGGGTANTEASLDSAERLMLETVIRVGAFASPAKTVPGNEVAFSVQAQNEAGLPLNFFWSFGDGIQSTEQSPTHAYGATGIYTATVRVSDTEGHFNFDTVLIQVLTSDRYDRAPTARFTTSDVVGFVGSPLAFDALYSTDPQNAITSYSWEFGDGSPKGKGQSLSKSYSQAGTYIAILTVTDDEGLQDTSGRRIEILPADQMGLFNAEILYKVKWDRNRQDRDSFSLVATLNVGDSSVGEGTAVAVEIAGTRISALLDGRLRGQSDNGAKWVVRSGLRNQSFGAVFLKLQFSRANLGYGFNQAGAVSGPGQEAVLDMPLRIEIGDRAFELAIPSEFTFQNDGTKAKGQGEGP